MAIERISSFRRVLRRTSPTRDERGTALLEAGLAVSALVVLMIAMIDIGVVLLDYIALTQVTNEGARYASRIAELTEGAYSSDQDNRPESHERVHNRVLIAVQAQNNISRLDEIVVTSEYLPLPEDQVRITVAGNYRGFFPMFDQLRMSVNHSAPHLFGVN